MLPKRYNPQTAEPELDAFWQRVGVYRFCPNDAAQVYAVDTPPATVSGKLHLGHTYSYSQTDFMARFFRMRGYHVFYPMGYDDNGLPTERLVEKRLGIKAAQVGRQAFAKACLTVGKQEGGEYRALWQRLGLSVDWRYTYRTIDRSTVRISQQSFLDLAHKDLVYYRRAPAIWCPECRTAIAQAELNDLERSSTFYTLSFALSPTAQVAVATTRPELLPACVALFVHPDDARYHHLIGHTAQVPFGEQWVPILADTHADPTKGTGVVMCCTFGDQTDVEWQRTHNLPLIEAIAPDGTMTSVCGELAGLTIARARARVVQILRDHHLLRGEQPIAQSVRVHERCDTPVEYVLTGQWFVRVLDFKPQLLDIGEQIRWHPDYMKARYQQWVENLNWDWCISRQRAFGVPFPLWRCASCGQVRLAQADQLPLDPLDTSPSRPCACGGTTWQPETDVMDTWATSSLTPQIAGQWLENPDLYRQVYPMSLRPQAHDIIRTWAFYTIVKSLHHFNSLPWSEVAISGWGIAGEGMGKISKSRGGGPMSPQEMIARYSADAVRYWAASTGLGKDAVISEEKIQMGHKLTTKLWNVARFAEPFCAEGVPATASDALSPADRWMLSRTQQLIDQTTRWMENYDYAAAKSQIENFFWGDLTDNYLEMIKTRLYDPTHPQRDGARFTLQHVLLTTLKLLAPLLPYVTEAIYCGLFAQNQDDSLHRQAWPSAKPAWQDEQAEQFGDILVEIATAVRRYKSAHNLSLGAELPALELSADDPVLRQRLCQAQADLRSVTRACQIQVCSQPGPGSQPIGAAGDIAIALQSDAYP